MKAEGSKEHIAFVEAKKRYLEVGKRYSNLLRQSMDSDPHILKIAEEILITGEALPGHDNKFLTNFYNELKAKSKIDKKYYDLLLELKKTKTELDNAVAALSRCQIAYILRKAGIPPKRTNQDSDIIAAQINDLSIGLLEKISLPEILDIETSESLEELVDGGELVCESGKLVPKTKQAREFVRKIEKQSRQGINDRYFLKSSDDDLLKRYCGLDPTNLLEFIRLSADKEHVREIERRIDAGDIKLSAGTLVPMNDKGKKYLSLLIEELSANIEKQLRAHLLEKNRKSAEKDPRLVRISSAMDDFDISLGKHQRLNTLAGRESSYQKLLDKISEKRESVATAFSELMLLQETIAASFADIKKQLLVVMNKNKLDVEKLLALLVAVRYLSVYENKYEAKLSAVERLLGLAAAGNSIKLGPDSIARLSEKYDKDASVLGEEVNKIIQELVNTRLDVRYDLGDATREKLANFLLNSPQVAEYRQIVSAQKAARSHVVDTLSTSNCLYRGSGDISEILKELIELEVNKAEKLTDLIHEFELAHKEFWLAKIAASSRDFINTNFANLSPETKARALAASKEAAAVARREIQETLATYRASHKKCSDEFAEALRSSLQELSKDADVSAISARLKRKYGETLRKQEELVSNMESDIKKLEKRLLNFEKETPAKLEKLLISDIRHRVEL